MNLIRFPYYSHLVSRWRPRNPWPQLLLFSCLLGISRCAFADVSLAWNPSPDPAVAGYRLYAGTASGVYNQTIEVGNSAATVLSSLIAGHAYYFAVTAYTVNGIESSPSNEIRYKTPPAPILSLSASASTVKKGESVTFTIKAAKAPPTSTIVVDYSVAGPAQSGVHYVLNNSTPQLVIPAGVSTCSFTLTALETNLTTGSEVAIVKLKKNSAYRISDLKRKVSVSILNKP
jgi:hypothetical protein